MDGSPCAARPRNGSPRAALVEAVRRAAQDLASRAEALSRKPEVERSLQGGGIAVNRLVLFSAARQTMEGASPSNWIAAFADPLGTVHAWWGDAPASLEGLSARTASGRAGPRRRSLSSTAARSEKAAPPGSSTRPARFPSRRPTSDGRSICPARLCRREPVAQTGGAALLRDASGRVVAGARRAAAAEAGQPWSRLVLAAILLIALLLVGRARDPVPVGIALALAFLAIQAQGGSHVLLSGRLLLLALGLLLMPFLLQRLQAGSPVPSSPS